MKPIRRLGRMAAITALVRAADAAVALADAHRQAATDARITATRFDRAGMALRLAALRLLLGPPQPVTPPPPGADS